MSPYQTNPLPTSYFNLQSNPIFTFLSQIRSLGWVLLPQIAQAFVGQRTRRFFPRNIYSDGTIVGYLPAKLNEGLALFHCVHDDGDTEDLDEREAETAVDNYAKKFTKIADSKKAEGRRKTQRQRQADKLAAAQNSLRELGKKIPVECVGYLETTISGSTPMYWSENGDSSSSSSSSSSSAAKNRGSSISSGNSGSSGGSGGNDAGSSVASELVVLKRFRDVNEAAVSLLTCWENQGQGLDDDENEEEEEEEKGGSTITKGQGQGSGSLNTAFLRSRLAEMKKCILRCCQGLEVHPNPKVPSITNTYPTDHYYWSISLLLVYITFSLPILSNSLCILPFHFISLFHAPTYIISSFY